MNTNCSRFLTPLRCIWNDDHAGLSYGRGDKYWVLLRQYCRATFSVQQDVIPNEVRNLEQIH